MGYDMRWCRVDDEEKEAVEIARKAFYAAAAERDALPKEEAGRFDSQRIDSVRDLDNPSLYIGRSDRYQAAQDKVLALSRQMDETNKSYFRLNIFGMGRYREFMYRLGMAFDDIEHPPWPKVEDYGVTHEEFWAVEDPEDYPDEIKALTPEKLQQVMAYQAERDRILSWHGKADTPGIPLHKFGSNDGWVVLPAECTAAVRIWEDHCTRRSRDAMLAAANEALADVDYWLKWIEYLTGAAAHGGFEVH